jgi:hypothetical protein
MYYDGIFSLRLEDFPPELSGKIALNLLVWRQSLLVDRIKVNRTGGDFAKRVDHVLVVPSRSGALIALHQLLGPFRHQQNQGEAVVNFVQAIFNCDPSHAILLVE